MSPSTVSGRMIMPKPTVLLLLLLLASPGSWVSCSPGDIKCLQQIKDSVNDPDGYLAGWKLSDPDSNHCHFFGVTCLHDEIYSLNLANRSLSGSFPQGLSSCKSLTAIDFSNNKFSGPISPTLCIDVPYLVSINLANNQFDGPVPENLVLCYYLNFIYLQQNSLCGPVPDNINNKTLERLRAFEFYGNKVDVNCTSPNATKSATGLIVGIAIGAVAVVFLVGLVGLVYWWLFSRTFQKSAIENDWIKHIKVPNHILVSMFDQPLVKIRLSDLMVATHDFSTGTIISALRSGVVYKGTLKDGSVMAIKRLEVTDHTNREFRAEMETLGKLRHRNLVPLLGYCIAGKERLLVYKHMPGGSLHDLLRRGSVSAASMDADVENGSLEPATVEMVERVPLHWITRLKLAIGTARGLAWLHHSCHPRVLHRNISPSCILLDEDLEPKISNFGLARLMNPVDTHISTVINGDFGDVGYVAPEYARTLVATIKGDVYGFGVLLLELVTGQNAADVKRQKFRGTLASWVWMLYNSGRTEEAVDKSLMDGSVRDDEVIQFLKLAISCVHPMPKERPSLYEVFHMLRAIGKKYELTDEDDEIPLEPSTGDEHKYELIVSNRDVRG